MNAIPAKVAGVAQIVMVAPAPRGHINPVVLAAAALAGVDEVYTVGGAQAVAALAYGTDTLPRVDKIVGPGTAMSLRPSGGYLAVLVSIWWPAPLKF